jgi:hypothetical protein
MSCYYALVATCSSANGLFFWLFLASSGFQRLSRMHKNPAVASRTGNLGTRLT